MLLHSNIRSQNSQTVYDYAFASCIRGVLAHKLKATYFLISIGSSHIRHFCHSPSRYFLLHNNVVQRTVGPEKKRKAPRIKFLIFHSPLPM